MTYADEIKQQGLIDFVVNAQKAILGGKGEKQSATLPGFSAWEYVEGEYSYRMYMAGYGQMHEISLVVINGEPVWASHLTGRMIEGVDKEVLRGVNRMLNKIVAADDPSYKLFRGPETVTLGKWKYAYSQQGGLEYYTGLEQLYHDKKLVYEANVIGGRIRVKRI